MGLVLGLSVVSMAVGDAVLGDPVGCAVGDTLVGAWVGVAVGVLEGLSVSFWPVGARVLGAALVATVGTSVGPEVVGAEDVVAPVVGEALVGLMLMGTTASSSPSFGGSTDAVGNPSHSVRFVPSMVASVVMSSAEVQPAAQPAMSVESPDTDDPNMVAISAQLAAMPVQF